MSLMDKYFVYIIKSTKDSKYYTGLTVNLEKRISEHNKGKDSTPSTKNRGLFILVYNETVETLEKAREREKFWKSGEGREMRNRMFG